MSGGCTFSLVATASPSSLEIAELTGQQRTLTLYGSGLPKRGAAWEGEQKLVTKWYPGNVGEATQHVLGPVELPSDWEGSWRTTQLLRTPATFQGSPLSNANDLADAMDSLRFYGALLRVTWAQDTGRKIVRVGRLGKFKAAYDRMDDLSWSASFVWVGRGGPQQSSVAFKKDDASGGMNAAILALNALASTISGPSFLASDPNVPFSSNVFSLGLSFSLAAGPTTLLGTLSTDVSDLSVRVGNVVDLMNQAGSLPPQLVSQASDVAMTATSTLVSFADEMGRTPAELMTTYDDRVSSLVRARVYFDSVLDAADTASASTAQMEAQLRRRQNALRADARRKDRLRSTEVLAVEPVRAGDTFVTLSLRYYGTPDRAADIARANGLPGYQIAPPKGKILVYPRTFGLDAPDTV